jgi:hypothetical protein
MGEKARPLLTYIVTNVPSIDGFKYAAVVSAIDPAHALTESTVLAAPSCRSVSSPALLSMLKWNGGDVHQNWGWRHRVGVVALAPHSWHGSWTLWHCNGIVAGNPTSVVCRPP